MSKIVRILAISDVELGQLYSSSIADRFQDLDLVLSCGDLPMFYMDFISSSLNLPLYYVLGNHHAESKRHSTPGLKIDLSHDGGVNLHQRSLLFEKKLLFLGMEGSIRYNRGPAQYTQEEMWRNLILMTPRLMMNYALYGRYLDVFATHSPPFKIHDQDDPPHIGFKAFRWFNRVFKPQVHLHGHIHIYRQDTVRETIYYQTKILNVYGYQIVEVEVPEK